MRMPRDRRARTDAVVRWLRSAGITPTWTEGNYQRVRTQVGDVWWEGSKRRWDEFQARVREQGIVLRASETVRDMEQLTVGVRGDVFLDLMAAAQEREERRRAAQD